MNAKHIVTLVAAVLVALVAAPVATANVPPGITNFQGVLRDAQNRPIAGAYAMRFDYWSDAASALDAAHIGSESHAAVTVTGGLFAVQLGSQPFVPGRSGYGGANIAVMFGDFDQVWLEITVGAETLSPRIRFAAAPYAFNCSQVQDRGPGEFLLNFESNSFHTGTLGTDAGTTLDVNGAIQLNGALRMDDDGPAGDQTIYFYRNASPTGESIRWAEASARFEASDRLLVNGTIHAGDVAAVPVAYNSLNFSTGTPSSGDMGSRGDLYVEADLEVDSQLYLNTQIRMDDDGPDGNQTIYFYDDASPTNESIAWSETEDRFEVSNDLAVAGTIRAGSAAAAPVAYNQIGLGTPGSQNVNASDDLYVAGSIELDQHLLLNGIAYMNYDGPDQSQTIFFYEGGAPGGRAFSWNDAEARFKMNDRLKLTGALELNNTLEMDDDGPDGNQRIYFYEAGSVAGESFGWTDANDRFETTDDLHVVGNLSATGAKPFVQNHPARADLSIVYAALEGNEVGTYTRGTSRLSAGIARIPLDETFAMVTNPAVGLTAHLTPRGAAASLYVESLDATTLVVRAAEGSPRDAVFDWVVYGLRIGFEEHAVVQPRLGEAPIPSQAAVEERFRGHPELRSYTALARFTAMAHAAGERVGEGSAARALRSAIGEYDPGEDRPVAMIAPAPEAAGREDAPSRPVHRSYPVLEAVEAGDVLVADAADPSRLRRADAAADAAVVGVAAGEPGTVYAAGALAPVVEVGIAWALVEAEGAPIERGDLLATSSFPGAAMRSADAARGTVLGKALEPLPSGRGLVRILVMLR